MFTKKENMIVGEEEIKAYLEQQPLPCPFCGNKSIIMGGTKNEVSGNVSYSIFCTSHFICGAHITTCLGGEETIPEARNSVLTAWNKRTNNGNV